jgi:hypothetical protein
MTGARRWPLFLIAAPAAVAVWSGWVGLGSMCGFGVVHPLPGILPGFQLDTAITLPIGVEAYGAYALGAWLTPSGVTETARTFARRSAIGALALGMLGQVVYHLLAAAHATRAPWPVVVLVSCLPVLTLGFGAALAHLLRVHPEAASESAPEGVPEAGPEAAFVTVPRTVPDATRGAFVSASGTAEALPGQSRVHGGIGVPERIFSAEIEAGELPSIRAIKRRMSCGQDKAREIREHLAALLSGVPETIEAVS